MIDFAIKNWGKILDKKDLLKSVKEYQWEKTSECLSKVKKSFKSYLNPMFEEKLEPKDIKIELKKTLKELETYWVSEEEIINTRNIDNYITNMYINHNIEVFHNASNEFVQNKAFENILEEVDHFIQWVVVKNNIGRYDEDLHAAWKIWVLKSLTKWYNPEQATFLTYVFPFVRQAIQLEKVKVNPNYNMPPAHEKIYSDYCKEFDNINRDASEVWDYRVYNEEIAEKVYKRYEQTGSTITKRLIKDVVNLKLSPNESLDSPVEDWSRETKIDLIVTEDTASVLNKNIDELKMMSDIGEWLTNHTDFEKLIIENRFGVNFGWETKLPWFKINCRKDWVEKIKEVPGNRPIDAMRKLELLKYEVLDTRKIVWENPCTIDVRDNTVATLREYLEVYKWTSLTTEALLKSERRIIWNLKDYFKEISPEQDFEKLVIN